MTSMSATPPEPSAAARLVLVADDSPTNIFVLTALLRALGFRTLTAMNGLEAVRLACEHRPEIILMDMQMPGLDGIRATDRIREVLPTQPFVFIAVTASPDVTSTEAFRRACFDGIITKPIELSVLRSMLARWLPNGPVMPQDGIHTA